MDHGRNASKELDGLDSINPDAEKKDLDSRVAGQQESCSELGNSDGLATTKERSGHAIPLNVVGPRLLQCGTLILDPKR